MPFLSWSDGGILRRQEVDRPLQLGRDPVQCAVAQPGDASVSRAHAVIAKSGGRWWIRDLESRNGTRLNGLSVSIPGGSTLADGDEIALGDWSLRFTEHFPGLDGVTFMEGVEDLFSELRPGPGQGMVLLRGLELLHRATESLLQEGSPEVLFRSILAEALKLLRADRGFVVMASPDGTWQSLHRLGDVEDDQGLSHSVVSYVLAHRLAVLSNAPLDDPRFRRDSLVAFRAGALMCAPMETGGENPGVLYLDRRQGRPFTRFDLTLLQTFVRQGALALRHTELVRKAMREAEIQGEYLRLRTLHDRVVKRVGELLGAMRSSLRWIQSYADSGYGDLAAVLRHQADRLQTLVESGFHETLVEIPKEAPASTPLQALQEALEPAWRDLLKIRRVALDLDPPPGDSAWVALDLAVPGVQGLVEPLLMVTPEGSSVRGTWSEPNHDWALRLSFSTGMAIPTPDPWTLRSLQESGIRWHWSEQSLTLDFPKAPLDPGLPGQSVLGLVTGDMELVGLFEGVAQAEDLGLQVLEPEPPRASSRHFKYLVVDAKVAPDPVGCVGAYRHHASFATVPILVIRALDHQVSQFLAEGTTDVLPEGFRWETLHHRLQVLKGHDELQRKARAAERLDSLRQMAGTLKHEINNPLAVISMQIELLIRKYPEEQKLQKVMEMVERIRGLVQVLQKMREASTEDYPGGESILKLG